MTATTSGLIVDKSCCMCRHIDRVKDGGKEFFRDETTTNLVKDESNVFLEEACDSSHGGPDDIIRARIGSMQGEYENVEYDDFPRRCSLKKGRWQDRPRQLAS